MTKRVCGTSLQRISLSLVLLLCAPLAVSFLDAYHCLALRDQMMVLVLVPASLTLAVGFP